MGVDRRDPEWRDIPGFDGLYQISRMGEVRSWRRLQPDGSPAKEPRIIREHPKNRGRQSRTRYVLLTKLDGSKRDYSVIRLMVDAWLGGPRPGLVAYHKNGDLADHCLNNIGFITRKELARKYGSAGTRKPVAKVDANGRIVEVYSSAAAAAKANYMSYPSVLDRCHGRIKHPYKLDGYTYRFER